jgi:hypothetical protein
VSVTGGGTAERKEFEQLPVLPFVVSKPTLDPVVLDDVGRGEVLGIDPSDESESVEVAAGPVGLELRGGDRGFPRFFRLLSTFSTPPERQWTFFGDEGPLTGRQGCSTIEAIATRPDEDLQKSGLGLSNYAALEQCVVYSANRGVK